MKLLKLLKGILMLFLFTYSTMLNGQRIYDQDKDPTTFTLPTNVPNQVPFGEMIGINENGLIFWDHVYDSTTGNIKAPIVRNSFRNTFDKMRIFHPIEKDYNLNSNSSNRANNHTISPCTEIGISGNRDYMCAMRNFYAVLRPDYDFIASASTIAVEFHSFPNKWFSYDDWGGPANAKENAYEYAIAFLETMDPNKDPANMLLDRFYVTNESWGNLLTPMQYNEVIDGFIEGFTMYYQLNRFATPDQNFWNIKMWHGAFQAFKASHVHGSDFVGAMLSPTARQVLEGLDVHPYSFSQSPINDNIDEHPESTNSFFLSVKSMVKWRNDQTDNVQNFKISATEFGWNDQDIPFRVQNSNGFFVVQDVNDNPSEDQDNSDGKWKIQHPGVGEEAQAIYTTRAYLMMARYGLESAYIYAALDNNESTFQNCGVYKSNPKIEPRQGGGFSYSNFPEFDDFLGEKLIMPAMRKLADPTIIGNKKYLQTLSEDDNGVYAILIGDDVTGSPTHLVAWHATNINKQSESQILGQTITRSLAQIGLAATGHTIDINSNSTRLDWHEGSINNINTGTLLNNQNLTLTPIPVVIPLNVANNCTPATNSWAQCESFESGLGIFNHANGDQNWTINQGSTTSSSTGPNAASDGNSYIYTESSGNNTGFPNKVFSLESNCFLLNGFNNPVLTFDYHMYGSSMGDLEIFIQEVGSNPVSVFAASGDQGNIWNQASINLSAYIGKNIMIRIEGTSSTSYRSDMALDNICISEDSSCSDVDADGVCDNVDCQPTNPNLPAPVGSSCNDFNSNTTNDVILADGCTCQGTANNLCSQVNASVSGNTITVNNLYGANQIIKIWTNGTLQNECNSFVGDNCGTDYTWTGQSNTAYDVTWQIYDAANNIICNNNSIITTSGGISCTAANVLFNTCESFESGLGIFNHANGDQNWTINQGSTTSSSTGPNAASDGNSYIYTESSGNNTGFPNKLFALESNCFLLNGFNNPILTFDYHMYGSSMGDLEIFIQEVGSNPVSVFAASGDQGNIWNQASINLSAYIGKNIMIRIEGTSSTSYRSDMALDNICISEDSSCSDVDADGVCDNVDCQPTNPNLPAPVGSSCNDFDLNTTNDVILADGCTCQGTVPSAICNQTIPACPYNEDWESGSFGVWTNATGDDFDWTNKTGSTISSGTGPSSAFSGSRYIYTEASGQNQGGKVAILESSCFTIPNDNMNYQLEFFYHMFGTAVGSLEIEASTDDINWNLIWSKSGNQGNSWTGTFADLNAYKGLDVKFRIIGTTGATWSSDIAIDKLEIVCTSNLPGINRSNSTEPTERELSSEDLNIIPNPSNGRFMLSGSLVKIGSQITIRNLNGTIVTQKIIDTESTLSFDLNVPAGTYFATIIDFDTGRLISKRIVIQNL